MARYIHVVLKLPSKIIKLLLLAKAVLTAMTGNASFPNPSPSLDTLDQRVTKLEAAIASGTAAERRAACEALRETLLHLGDYVQSVAESQAGSVDILAVQALVETAGMKLRKVGARAKQVFAAASGPDPGSVDLTAPASPDRDPHEWQDSADASTWTSLPSTRKARTRVTGLPAGAPHYFRHRTLTKDGHTAWSDPVMIVVK